MNIKTLALLAACTLLGACASYNNNDAAPSVVWKTDQLENIGGHRPSPYDNAPALAFVAGKKAIRFDGESTGLLVPAIPYSGWKNFTLEIDFYPESGGGFEQRFFHAAGDAAGPRTLFELRSNPDGTWYFDGFLYTDPETKLVLIDPEKTHPSDQWYTATLVYNGAKETLTSYVNGVKQGEGKVRFAPPASGVISLGVRQNKVSWFKGAISEVRFYPEARVPRK